jgi:acetyl-CoA carboxylase biotin carboxylase subunit
MTKVLIANRGEIARRIIRTCHAMGIGTVAVYSEVDAHSAYVREADEAVPLGGRAPADSYLRVDLLVDAARRAGADAVHPGYGFLSEHAGFARACIDAGLMWVGPPPAAIDAMGSKVAARELMASSGVPVLPGADVSAMPEDKVAAAADEVGWPLLVKASYGGGGRGMRIVRDRGELSASVESARREAEAAFGDGSVFLERYVEQPRHIEIQVLGDMHGNVVHLFERECTIQRRHQKIIEEAPSPAVDADLRRAMGDAAVRAALAVGYVGAGTVEFILAPNGTFYFLEMNTRLQVEHPVTELVTGLDLVRLQLLVARGEELPPEARTAMINGHAIEARLYAEDPDNGYLPAPGHVDRIAIDGAPGLRVDAGYEDGDDVTPHYDALLAKVIAHAPTRGEAVQRLERALRRARLHGIVTNRELLVGVLAHAAFRACAIDTEFLDRHPPQSLAAGRVSGDDARLCALAAALALQARSVRAAPVLAAAPAGWRNNPSQLQRRRFASRAGEMSVGYAGGRRARFEIDGSVVDHVRVVSVTADRVDLLVDGVTTRFDIHLVADRVHVDSPRGSLSLHELPRFPSAEHAVEPGSLVAPMPGKIVRVAVTAGDRVVAGQLLVVVEAMKMEHQINAPRAGVVVDVRVALGQAVDTDAVLVVMDDAREDA